MKIKFGDFLSIPSSFAEDDGVRTSLDNYQVIIILIGRILSPVHVAGLSTGFFQGVSNAFPT